MKKLIVLIAVVVLTGGLLLSSSTVRETAAHIVEYFYSDPDMPFETGMSKEEYMLKRSEHIAMLRGIDKDHPYDFLSRPAAIQKLEEQESLRKSMPESSFKDDLFAAWTPIGPNPIPNGQTLTLTTPVSGRVTAIDVHPTNPDIVYVGTAQGGVYRSLNGGSTWTPLMDSAQSLAIGAIRIAPSQPETVYVGTGEPNFSSDSYFGVGVYRIDNASTTATLSGPFGSTTPFQGRGIGEIIVHPTNPAMIWVGSTSAAAAINGGAAPPTLSNRGIFRADNATSGSPTFVQMPFPFANQNLSVRDMEIDPLNPDLLVANVVANGGGIVVYNNATVAPATSAVGVQRATWTSTATSELVAEIAIQHSVGALQPTIYVATGNLGGRVLMSTDGGVNFPQQIDNNFCTAQCFYDIAIDTDPNDPTRVYLGGSPNIPFGFSINSGTTFTVSSAGLHVDSHVIAVAPSNANRVYFGSDGGIYRSDTAGLAWTAMNTAGFSATQFMGIDTHPTDPNITIGGTQDNGTNRYQADGTWTRTDFGDGGYSVIDQSSSSVVAFNQYHTYFNASNLTAYAFSTNPAAFENWTVRGCNGGVPNDGITCTATINFYAPLERGPGTPNTIYYGSDRLYRSIDTGDNHTTVSQTFTSPLSAIGISPQDDNVRIIGLNDGRIFGTTIAANPLVDLDPTNAVPAAYVSRVVVDPNVSTTAYVTLALFNAPNVYKTTNLNASPPTWTAVSGAATGLAQVPVNALVVDPLNSNNIYAGTDIGVYISGDGGTSWIPFGSGLPRIAVFDMAVSPGRMLRIATHGRGLYQIPMFGPTAAGVSVSGRILSPTGTPVRGASVVISDSAGASSSVRTNTFGYYLFDSVQPGQTYLVSVAAKGYSFTPKSITITDRLLGLDFIADQSTENLFVNKNKLSRKSP
jgi:hypothetical protein